MITYITISNHSQKTHMYINSHSTSSVKVCVSFPAEFSANSVYIPDCSLETASNVSDLRATVSPLPLIILLPSLDQVKVGTGLPDTFSKTERGWPSLLISTFSGGLKRVILGATEK